MDGWLTWCQFWLKSTSRPHSTLCYPSLPSAGWWGKWLCWVSCPLYRFISVWFGLVCVQVLYLLWHLTFKSVRDICDTRPLAHRLLFHNNAHVSTYSCTSQTIACLPSTRVRKEKLWVLHILPPFLYIYNAVLLQLRKNDCWTIWESTCWLPV